jgi:hypothetical protein
MMDYLKEKTGVDNLNESERYQNHSTSSAAEEETNKEDL